MTYQIYSHQQLQLKSIAHLKQIYSEIACTVEVSDKRCKDAWISTIVNYQASKVQKLAPAAPDEQAAAQAVAPEPLTIVEISFDHHEYYADDKLVASISHDDNHLTQRWVVMINDKELFRANTLMRCDRFICTHYKDGTLLVEAEVQGSRDAEGKNLQQLSPLPLCSRTPMLSSFTENRIMAHIFNECQNGTQEKWLGVVNFAESELGKKVPLSGTHYRGHLGTWVRTFYPHLGDRQETRLVNGVQQQVYVYACHDPAVAAGLTKAIEEFFAHPSPGAALRQAGAFSWRNDS